MRWTALGVLFGSLLVAETLPKEPYCCPDVTMHPLGISRVGKFGFLLNSFEKIQRSHC